MKLEFNVALCGELFHKQYAYKMEVNLTEKEINLIKRCQALLQMKGNEDMKFIAIRIEDMKTIDDRGVEIDEVEYRDILVGRETLWFEGYYEDYPETTFFNMDIKLNK